jgi:hypothetical protein
MDGRVELKYCVHERVAAHVLEIARAYLAPEPLARGARQRITSLYLDTDHLTFLRWHQSGAGDRFKLRVRGYGDPPGATLFAEIKRKTGAVVRKQRTPFAAERLDSVLEGCRRGSNATPRVLIRGIRESLRDPGSETAVTVDHALEYQPTRRSDLTGQPDAWRPLPLPTNPGQRLLVELKYGGAPPEWMDALIRTLAGSRVSFSKYVAAMTACGASPAADISAPLPTPSSHALPLELM